MPEYLPGLVLSHQFYRRAVRPVLDAEFPGLSHAAALIGPGSEVLGFDTPMSTDHDWGPRVLLFLREEDAHRRDEIDRVLEARLPGACVGFRTDLAASGGRRHAVRIETLRGFVLDYLGFDLEREIEPADWLTFPSQKLRSLTAGGVYHDEVGLAELRARFAWYPRDVWLYLLASAWTRLSQEQHLMGRAGSVSDELGSAVIGSRLVRDVMRLAFLMERQHAPYPKWLGTAFKRLECGPALYPLLLKAQTAKAWTERETHLCAAYAYLAEMHDTLALTAPVEHRIGPFFGRPFRVLHGEFAGALLAEIRDPWVREIARRRLIGSVDLFSDSTDLLEDPGRRASLRRLYEPE